MQGLDAGCLILARYLRFGFVYGALERVIGAVCDA